MPWPGGALKVPWPGAWAALGVLWAFRRWGWRSGGFGWGKGLDEWFGMVGCQGWMGRLTVFFLFGGFGVFTHVPRIMVGFFWGYWFVT